MYFIDTNIFLELLLNQKRAEECEKLFDLLQKENIHAVASHFSIYSICIYSVKTGNSKKTGKFLEYVLSLKNLDVINTTLTDDMEILKFAEKMPLDFDDSLQYYLATEAGCDAIITFDKDFKKTKMKLFTPKEVLRKESLEKQAK